MREEGIFQVNGFEGRRERGREFWAGHPGKWWRMRIAGNVGGRQALDQGGLLNLGSEVELCPTRVESRY